MLGYKFNIFYPDLIDKSQPPTFKLEDLPNEPGFGMIRFSAGPPYEDIAFKIVDNPWLHGRKSGYRSVILGGIYLFCLTSYISYFLFFFH